MTQVVNGIGIPGIHGIDDAVTHMILQDHFSGVVKSGTDGCQLDQNFRAVTALFNHAFHFFQVTDRSGEAIDDGFLIFVDMTVVMGDAMLVEIGVIVFMGFFGCMGVNRDISLLHIF